MTVSAQTPYSSQAANGVTTSFPFAYKVRKNTDIVVMLVDADGNETIQTLGVHYTVSGVGAAGGGSVDFLAAPAAGLTVKTYRVTALARSTDYQNNGDLLAAVLNGDVDAVWLALQELLSGTQSAANVLRGPVGEVMAVLAAAVARKDLMLGFNSATGAAELSTFTMTQVASAIAAAYSGAAGPLDALSFLQSGAGAVSRTAQDKARESVSITDYAANGVAGARVDPTGVLDSTLGIQAALDHAKASAGEVLIPAGTYRTTASLLVDGNTNVRGAGFSTSVIKPDATVLEAVKIGSVSSHQGVLRDFAVQRAAYDGATENAGFAFYGAFDSSYYDIVSSLSKYNYYFRPGNGQAVAYCNLLNVQGSRGYRNVYWKPSGTGYANELKFYGGRMFASADTETNVHWNGGSNTLFDGVSAEAGPATNQAFYIGGAGNKIINPRTEGVWLVNDIVVDAAALRTFIMASDFYTTITDNGTGTTYITHNGGTQLSSTLNSVAPLTLRYAGNTDNTILPIYSSRDNGTSFSLAGIRSADGVVRWSLSTDGRGYLARSLNIAQSGYNFEPLVLGNYWIWINNSQLYIKNGAAPANANDGRAVNSNQVQDTAANIASIAAAINTTDKFVGKLVWDTTNNRMMRASGGNANSTWHVIDGSASVVPA